MYPRFRKGFIKKKDYYDRKFLNEYQTNPKRTWKLINKAINRCKSNECISHKFKVDDQTITDPYDIVSRYKLYIRMRKMLTPSFHPVTEDEVSKEIS